MSERRVGGGFLYVRHHVFMETYSGMMWHHTTSLTEYSSMYVTIIAECMLCLFRTEVVACKLMHIHHADDSAINNIQILNSIIQSYKASRNNKGFTFAYF